MRTSLRMRAATVFATAAVLAGGGVLVGAGSASAAVPTNVKFWVSDMDSDGSRSIGVEVNGKWAGAGYWTANGDQLQAVDTAADGFGIAAYLGTSPVREASTYGHSSPYTATKTGNLPEDKKYTFWVCVGGSAGQVCSDVYNVTS
ncbi:MAG: hypothetical protein JF597_33025 [Streptomyces sp.]|jgi:hypothetical protein|uniref:hypothetical protein n=1 Tax=Streptomyces sp. TaxID=1931 RepID=UPI0025FCA9D4|nr:hypothetical protein [Streptomyces sp.]MBW8798234.1 hypothetical protein [Streptomyces sp.]